VDIASGSPLSKQAPSYALFIISGDGEERHPMVSRQKLIRMIRQRAPEIVAVDSVHELAADRSDLVWLLRQMPPGTRVVRGGGCKEWRGGNGGLLATMIGVEVPPGIPEAGTGRDEMGGAAGRTPNAPAPI